MQVENILPIDMSYNRYNKFIKNGVIGVMPHIDIREKSSDKYVYYELGRTRFDLLSYEYYKDCDYGWLILEANPQLPPYEFMIDNGTIIRIPYPLEQTISEYESAVEEYKELNGIS